jgi:nucleoside-triphosphatase THEP1
MDVELQILKHLAREAQPTVSFIDKYCVGYSELRERRLSQTLAALKGNALTVVIDETGDFVFKSIWFN